MKKTPFIWLALVALGLSIIAELLATITLIVTGNFALYYGNQPALNALAILSLAIDLALTVVFWRKLWILGGDVLRWTHVYFEWSVIRSVYAIAADVITNKGTQFDNIVELAVIVTIWALLYKHLKAVVSPSAPVAGMSTKKAFLWLGGIIVAVLALYAGHTVFVFSTTALP